MPFARFQADGSSRPVELDPAPVRAPRARAHAERWVASLRREGFDRLLILGRRHLASVVHVLHEYELAA